MALFGQSSSATRFGYDLGHGPAAVSAFQTFLDEALHPRNGV
ncbi:hypothetical protein OCH239_13105 [Roseivivax halodurans JCM 10272]|uniref:Uncharacterized protein n=1 Tax=Roseivivax halodurans JCM 10272 TaxID=1449350 RepID=X7EAP9_9RHOB|nr:hypothetical protein [Roseivivax halodurans]ETX13164.1 hypothetical protein OCH239_13105 [Roseivivax halodurans JCM 10272]